MNEQRIADLDQLDLQILRLYQRDTQTPAHLIAERVGLSAAAVQRRLKRMRETGAIQKEIAHYKAFTGRALSDENVRSFTTHVVLERSKVGLTLPLDSLRRE